MKLLITGGAGFIRSNFVQYVLASHADWQVVVLDKLTYAGNLRNLTGAMEDPRLRFIRLDICEASPLEPTSPYAASKAASDVLILSAVKTYRFPAIITRCTNNYGPFQFPEKFIPLMISQAFAGQYLPVYGDGKNVRDWIHVADHCLALDLIFRTGKNGEIYNIGGGNELENIVVARKILQLLGRPESLLKFVVDRPGHDRRYALDCTKLKNSLGWEPRWKFEKGLTDTIRWYQENSDWLAETLSREYKNYFDRHYTRRDPTFATFVKS